MYCKDCKFRSIPSNPDELPICQSPNLRELTLYDRDGDYKPSGNRLLYSYEENGYFHVEDYFGCVHFQERVSGQILYACAYSYKDSSFGMWAGPHPSLIEMEKHKPEYDYAVIIRLSDSVIVRRWVDGQWTSSVLS